MGTILVRAGLGCLSSAYYDTGATAVAVISFTCVVRFVCLFGVFSFAVVVAFSFGVFLSTLLGPGWCPGAVISVGSEVRAVMGLGGAMSAD